VKKTAFILSFLISVQIFACGGAFQLRYFPIGTNDSKVILIETSLNRYWAPDTMGALIETRDRWRGVVTLKSLGKNGIYTTIKIIDTIDILDKDYSKELSVPFSKALSIASALKGFAKAELLSVEFCNFKSDCQLLDLVQDTLTNKLFVITNDQRKIAIEYPAIVEKESESNGGISNMIFKISSIRRLKLLDINLIVIDFLAGEDHNGTSDQPNTPQFSPNNAYPEMVIYHGLNFDAIIWD
jgi:hypothetical protein